MKYKGSESSYEDSLPTFKPVVSKRNALMIVVTIVNNIGVSSPL
jgi:hypothetical protein